MEVVVRGWRKLWTDELIKLNLNLISNRNPNSYLTLRVRTPCVRYALEDLTLIFGGTKHFCILLKVRLKFDDWSWMARICIGFTSCKSIVFPIHNWD
jgi:hypothetical protein